MEISNSILLDSIDYQFVDEMCIKFLIPEGMGYKNQLSSIINEYKKFIERNKQ